MRFVVIVVRVGVAVMGVLGADDFDLYGWSEDGTGDLGDAFSRFSIAALEIAAESTTSAYLGLAHDSQDARAEKKQ